MALYTLIRFINCNKEQQKTCFDRVGTAPESSKRGGQKEF